MFSKIRERDLRRHIVAEELGVGVLVARALRNHNVWLVLGYVLLILLMARVYA